MPDAPVLPQTILLLILGVEEELYIPPPEVDALFPEKVEFAILGDEEILIIPPPPLVPILPEIIQLVKKGEEVTLHIPPPLLPVLPEKILLVSVGDEDELYIPPPEKVAIFAEKVQLEMDGADASVLNNPAPLLVTSLVFILQLLMMGEDATA